ncbi:MAG: hypothetical protein C6I01_03900 [Epsilonproteobacteria bacterium]|jgi:hypothetical protein|nr:hypothetical protein [Campylobacterota bacterium]NPA89553.1 DUF1080 domain-containing protein [Campylobacterota bacterium]
MKKIGVGFGLAIALILMGGCQKVGEVLGNPTTDKIVDTAKKVVTTLTGGENGSSTGGNGVLGKVTSMVGGGRLFPIAKPYFQQKLLEDDFSQYGLGQRAPFGPWTGDGAVIKMAVQWNKMSGKIMETTRPREAVCISKKVAEPKNLYLRTYYFANWPEGDISFRNREALGVGYMLNLKRTWGTEFQVTLYKKAGNQYTPIAQNKFKLPLNTWQEVEIMANGPKIKVSVGGTQLLDITDNDPNLQAPGRICFGGEGGKFDDVLIYSLRPVNPN